MAFSPAGADAPPRRPDHLFGRPRQGRQPGIPLTVANPTGSRQTPYVPVFPVIFCDDELSYHRSYDVLFTDYLQRGLYGYGALMKWEHYGMYQSLMFQASRGEKFYAADLAVNYECSINTVTRNLDRLENLRLIRRVRNGCSFDRWISIVMAAPLPQRKLVLNSRKAGRELMSRVSEGFVQQERKAAGPGRWPSMQWDAETMLKALKGRDHVPAELKQMQHAIDTTMSRVGDAGYNDFNQVDFETQVESLCHSWDAKFSAKLFLTAMCERQLNARPAKEAAL